MNRIHTTLPAGWYRRGRRDGKRAGNGRIGVFNVRTCDGLAA